MFPITGPGVVSLDQRKVFSSKYFFTFFDFKNLFLKGFSLRQFFLVVGFSLVGSNGHEKVFVVLYLSLNNNWFLVSRKTNINRFAV